MGCKALAGLLSVGNIVQYTGGVTQFISGFSMLMTQLADLKMMSKDFEFYFDYLDRKMYCRTATAASKAQRTGGMS
ncbi:MAG: hypothetical protein ACLSB9_07130 [Hydrogeniiclostridium mannosilyticum]